MVTKYVRQWLDLPISTTISSIILSQRRFGQAFQLPAVEYQQCQTTLRSSLKSSGDEAVRKLGKNTNSGANLQYDVYRNTKQALKSIRSEVDFSLNFHYRGSSYPSSLTIPYKSSARCGQILKGNCLQISVALVPNT